MSRSMTVGSTGWPEASRSAGASPLRTPDSGSGHRLTSRAYSAAPIPRMSSCGVGVGHGGRVGEHHVAVDADAHPAGVVDGQGDTGAVGRVGGGGQRLHGPDGADGRRRGVGDLLQRTAANPLRDHQAAGSGVDDVEHPGDAGLVDPAEPQGAGQDVLQNVLGQGPVRVDEGQRHLPVQRGVERLPELQGRRTAVEDQQPVAAAGDTGAGNQVDRRGMPAVRRPLAGCIDVALVGPRVVAAEIAAAPVCDTPARNVGLEVVGDRPVVARRLTRSWVRRSPMGGRSPPVLSLSGRWLPAPEACAGSAPGPHLPPAGTNFSAQGT